MTIYRPFFPSQTIDEEVVALILYRLVEQYDSNKPKKHQTNAEQGPQQPKIILDRQIFEMVPWRI